MTSNSKQQATATTAAVQNTKAAAAAVEAAAAAALYIHPHTYLQCRNSLTRSTLPVLLRLVRYRPCYRTTKV